MLCWFGCFFFFFNFREEIRYFRVMLYFPRLSTSISRLYLSSETTVNDISRGKKSHEALLRQNYIWVTKDRQFKGNAQKAITSDSDHSLKAAPNRGRKYHRELQIFRIYSLRASLTTILHYSPFSISQFYLQHPSSLSHSLYIGTLPVPIQLTPFT